MMTTALEIRSPDEARQFLLSGVWLSRAVEPTEENLSSPLAWSLHLASEGHAFPPLGFVADVGALALGGQHSVAPKQHELPGVDPGLLRRYEDYVLGKLYADLSFERAVDALQRYPAAQRTAGVAYLIERICVRTEFAGVLINPAAIRKLQETAPAEVLREAWQQIQGGLPEQLERQIERLIECIRNTGDVLVPADIFELEHGTALVEFGQRFALRQVLQMAEMFLENLPAQRPRRLGRRQQVATRLLAEDAYPVGGFSSLSNRGSIESLLHSQLALIEPDERPDLFDVKYVRDELLYYSRDENQFLRRRSTFCFVFPPELAAARIKDAGLPCQRIVAALGLTLALVRRLTAWLSDEALTFRFVFLTKGGTHPLVDEQALLQLLLREQIENGSAVVETLSAEQLIAATARESRRSLVQVLTITTVERPLVCEGAAVIQLLLSSPEPHLLDDRQAPYCSEERGLAAWQDVLLHVLTSWT